MLKKITPIKVFLAVMAMIAVVLCVTIFLGRLFDRPPAVSAITTDGVITEIKKLNRLNTVAFSVDTVITAQKQGNWYKLWQDGQKGLFVANGRVNAGVDLSKLSTNNVTVTYGEQTNPKVAPMAHIQITLPPAQIFDVYLDNIQMYDWQTGVFGLVNNSPEILNQVQISGKTEILNKACRGDIMAMAGENAKEHIQGLFALTGATVDVIIQPSDNCVLAS